MVCPILISVSVMPGALAARAGQALVARAAAAAALDCRNVRRFFMFLFSRPNLLAKAGKRRKSLELHSILVSHCLTLIHQSITLRRNCIGVRVMRPPLPSSDTP